jgi:hypothetical protein
MSAAKSGKPAPVPALDTIEGRILLVRGQKALLRTIDAFLTKAQ